MRESLPDGHIITFPLDARKTRNGIFVNRTHVFALNNKRIAQFSHDFPLQGPTTGSTRRHLMNRPVKGEEGGKLLRTTFLCVILSIGGSAEIGPATAAEKKLATRPKEWQEGKNQSIRNYTKSS